jgi:hypothetical protein
MRIMAKSYACPHPGTRSHDADVRWARSQTAMPVGAFATTYRVSPAEAERIQAILGRLATQVEAAR